MYTLEPLNITKELILNRIPEERIMEHYLGVSVRKGLFKSPLRNDSKPTCAFYRNKQGDLMFKDFRGDFCGNFISVVMHKFNCSFGGALQIIANDFNIISRKDLIKNETLIEYSNTEFKETADAIIQVELQPFSDKELEWWATYNITKDILSKYRVVSCKNVFLNGNIFSLQSNSQMVFGYFGGWKNDLERWRVYFPKRTSYRFLSNWKSTDIQGAHMLDTTSDYVVVTKSLKDVMVLYSFGVNSIAPISENCFLTDEQYEKLKSKYKHIIVFYDNDLAGIENMNKIRKRFTDVHVLYIPRAYEAKDISDFYKKYGHERTLKAINFAKNIIYGKNR